MHRVNAVLLAVLTIATLGGAHQEEDLKIERQRLIAYDMGALENASITIDKVIIPAGQTFDMHTHYDYHEFIWVMEGELTVNVLPAEGVEPTRIYLVRGDTDIAPVNTVHGGFTEKGAEVLVVKVFPKGRPQ